MAARGKDTGRKYLFPTVSRSPTRGAREVADLRKQTSGISLANPRGMKKRPLVRRSLVLDAGLDKLQTFLLTMLPGEEVSVPRAAEISGLDPAQCGAVLETLVRAGLMIRLQHDAYVRQRAA
jgi:hypothetical protein